MVAVSGTKVLLVPLSALLTSVDVIPSLEASLLPCICRRRSLPVLSLPALLFSSLWSIHLGCRCYSRRHRRFLRSGYLVAGGFVAFFAAATWSLADLVAFLFATTTWSFVDGWMDGC